MIIPVLLSGGIGIRLWPLSTPESPKQFLRIFGRESLLQAAALRVMGMDGFGAPLVVTGRSMQGKVTEHLSEIGCAPAAVLAEPSGRNTAPAAMAAALWAEPDDLLLGLPTDHLVTDVEAFRAAIRRGVPAARTGDLVIFGIEPTHPHPGLGYMEVVRGPGAGPMAIRRFVEKPDVTAARRMVESGGYLWNGGMFLTRADAMRKAIARLLPEVVEPVSRAFSEARHHPDGTIELGPAFREAPNVSVAKGLWERAERVRAVPMAAGWSDVGSWQALEEILGGTDRENVIRGTAVVESAGGVQVHSPNTRTAVVGVSDVVVVVANGRVLVAGRDMWEKTGETVKRLEALS